MRSNDYYRPQTKLREGNVFTGVCLLRGDGYPWVLTLGVGTHAPGVDIYLRGGTHPLDT